jgi:hypothetical protein
VAAGPLAGEVVQLSLNSRAPVELENDPPSRWIAADSGELFAEQVDGSIEVSGGGTDRFDVVAFLMWWRYQFIWRPSTGLGGVSVMASRSVTATRNPESP